MIFSGALCGQLADRFGRADLILTVCLVGGMVSFALLPQAEWAIATSLAYGLIGVAPAGLIVALTAEAMAPHKRAFGMGVYQSLFSILTATAPAVAGWLFDCTGDPYVAIQFGIALMAVTLAAYYSFRLVQRRPGGVNIHAPSWRTDRRIDVRRRHGSGGRHRGIRGNIGGGHHWRSPQRRSRRLDWHAARRVAGRGAQPPSAGTGRARRPPPVGANVGWCGREARHGDS
jgi:MFS family permease